MTFTRSWMRHAALVGALLLVAPSIGAQGQGRFGGPAGTNAALQAVRTALGHGQAAEARRLAEAASAATIRELGNALVDIFEGKNPSARARLEPLARANPNGDAALELGLLELRTGQRDQGMARLDPLAANRTFNAPEDYYRLARAARGIREFLLANDAYVRIADIDRADVQSEWGDLFLERHQPGDAAINYQKAIELDANWVPAYAGLARALAEQDPKAAAEALDAGRKIAPDDPRVWLAAAELQMDAEDVDAAVEALDRLAKGRPGSVEEAALRAAVAYARDDTAGMDAALARVRELDQRSALGYRRVGEQAARLSRLDAAAGFARQATVLDPDDPVAYADLGQYLMETGEETEARAALERSWNLDQSNPHVKNELEVLDKIDTFDVVRSGDYIFKFAKDESAVLRNYALPIGEEASRVFGERYGFTPTGPIVVEVFPVHDDFAVRTIGFEGLEFALGACFGRLVAMDSPRARPPGEFSWQATLWHELAHVYTLQLSRYRVPRWLTEGISVFEEHRREAAWGREQTLEFAQAYGRGRTFGVKKLPEAFKQPESLALAYFEASLVVEHLVDLNGDEGLRRLLLAYANGAKDADAFTQAFGQSLDDVEASFKTFVDERYGALAKAMAAPDPPVKADDLAGLRQRAGADPGNFRIQWLLGAALVKSGDLKGARGPLERAAALAPAASGDDSPHALLALIDEQSGDVAGARHQLRQLLAADHANVNAARKLASLAGTAPEASADRDFALQRVADLDPFDAAVHGELGRRLFTKADYVPALVEFRAALALGPPNLAEARTDIAETLLKMGRKEEAKGQALLALQEAPAYARAQDVLLEAMGKDR